MNAHCLYEAGWHEDRRSQPSDVTRSRGSEHVRRIIRRATKNDSVGRISRNGKDAAPELETIDGFFANIRYRSLTRDGWIPSLSSWRNEKALVRWRTRMRYHQAQEKGRAEILADYHLRVGQSNARICSEVEMLPRLANDF